MFDHGAMNRFYRLVWNESKQCFVPIPEISTKRGKRKGRAYAGVAAAAMALLVPLQVAAQTVSAPVATNQLPTGGQVVGGSGTITTDGTTQTIAQTSQNLAIDWNSFSIGKDGKVIFNQPNASSIALNRVIGGDASQIFGVLQANGQVFLLNPNGVLFARGSQVSAAGILASTRDMKVSDFMAGKYVLSGSSSAGITNASQLAAANGGYIVLTGARVINEGSLGAGKGDIRLAAADEVIIRIDGSSLFDLTIGKGSFDALVANSGIIKADGGRIYLTADAIDTLAKASVNNTGVIEALTVENVAGKIVLMGDMKSGAASVAGTLNASAPSGGNGGFIETSAAKVSIADDAHVTTKAEVGLNGQWLIDPTDFTIAASGGDMTGTALATALGSSNVTIQSTSGVSGTSGNINVNATVAWSANTLTLNALGDIAVNATMTATGAAKLAFQYGQATASGSGSKYTLGSGAKINLPAGQNFSTKQGNAGSVVNYTVITALGTSSDTNGTTLQGVTGQLSGNFVLGADIDASATMSWNPTGSGGYYGFTPIGQSTTSAFTGTFDGLGHTIADLNVNTNSDNNGLFSKTSSAAIRNLNLNNPYVTGTGFSGIVTGDDVGSTISNIKITNGSVGGTSGQGGIAARSSGVISEVDVDASVLGTGNTGGIVGTNFGTVRDSTFSGTATIGGNNTGGAVGLNTVSGQIINVTVSGDVSMYYTMGDFAGGLVGYNDGSIVNSTTTNASSVTGINYVGGLIGYNNASLANLTSNANVQAYGGKIGGFIGSNADGAALVNVSATGSVSGQTVVGGLVGYNSSAALSDSWASGQVTATSGAAGGLVGQSGGSITNSYATGNVSGDAEVGGLVGSFTSATISNSHATGNVSGNYWLGGLLGTSDGSVSGVYASGEVSGGTQVGGLIGWNRGTITGGASSGNVAGTEDVGGVAGWNEGTLDSVSSTSALMSGAASVGGLVGKNKMGGTLTNSDRTIGSLSGTNNVGGLVGLNEGAISNGTSSIAVNGSTNIGGVAGSNSGTVADATATGNVSGTQNVGGLVGYSSGTISDSGAASDVAGIYSTGGLIGVNDGAATDVHASGRVHDNDGPSSEVGGLVGSNNGTITRGSASGDVSGMTKIGGLVGTSSGSIDSSSKTAGSASAIGAIVGGLVGENHGQLTNSSVASGIAVSGNGSVGGAVGVNTASGSIQHVQAAAAVSSTSDIAGGVVGLNIGDMSDVHASGSVNGTGLVGGVVGQNDSNGTIALSDGDATVAGQALVGGFAGENLGQITHSESHGDVSGILVAGGFAGDNYGTISASTAHGNVTGSNDKIGGFIGENGGEVSDAQAHGNVAGNDFVGGFAGYTSGANVTNSSASGSVSGNNLVGGFAGAASGNLTQLSASGAVTGVSSVGGLVGANSGAIDASTSTSSVTASGNGVGGLVGALDDGSIDNSTASGAVTGHDHVGGLVGATLVNARVDTSHASGNVSGNDYVGGLVGYNVSHIGGFSSASGDVSGHDNVGGLTGYNSNTINQASATGNVTGNNFVGGISGMNAYAIQFTTYTGIVTGNDYVGGIAGDNQGFGGQVYNTANGEVHGHDFVGGVAGLAGTVLYGVTSNMAVFGHSGVGGIVGQNDANLMNGSSANGNVIATGTSVGGVVGINTGAIFETAFTGTTVSGGSEVGGFIGTNTSSSALGGLTVNGNVIVTGAGSMVGGLIGYNTGEVGWSRSGAVVNGAQDVGGLIGNNAGSLATNYATGAVNLTGSLVTASAGGLVGVNSGLISVAYATGNISATGGGNVGGLIGSNSGNVSNAYATGAISGASHAGGFIGAMSGGSVENVYGKGAVTGASMGGGLIGQLSGGTVANGYWNVATTGLASGVGASTGGSLTGAGLTAQQGKNQASYVGFDFSAGGVWKNYNGDTSPLLTAWLTDLTVTVGDGPMTFVYSGSGRQDAVSNLTFSDSSAQSSGHLFGSAHYDTSKNVGTYTDLTGLYSDQQGYNITFVNNGSLSITPKAINVAATAPNKTYDGTTAVSVDLGSTGIVAGDDVSFVGTGAMADKNAGVGKAVSVTGITGLGADVGNYSFNSAAGTTVDVGRKMLSLTAVGTDKIYDGTTAVGVTVSTADLVAGDTVVLTGVGSLADKNAGAGKAVTVSNISASGADAGNYAFAETAHGTANVERKTISVTGTGVDRAYNGTNAVDVALSSSGVVTGDIVSFAGVGSMADKNAGNGKAVTISGISATGADAANYALANTGTSGSVNIGKRVIAVIGNGVDRTYDGTTAVDVALSSSDAIAGDDLRFTGTGTMATKNAGSGKSVAISGITAQGIDASNYELASGAASGTVSIAKRAVAVSGVATDRNYDGTTAVAVNLSNVGVLSGDVVTFSGTGNLADKNVGRNKAVDVSVIGSGADIGNYSYNATTSATANIDPKSIQVSLVGPIVKSNDGTSVATLSPNNFTVSGLVPGESVTVNQALGSFDSAEVGSGRKVTATLSSSAYTAGPGTDLGNYALVIGDVASDAGQIIEAVKPGYQGAINAAQNLPSTNGSASIVFSSIIGSQGPATSTGDSDNTVATGSSNSSVDGGIASIQTKEALVYRRTFSIADGGIRLPAGVSDGDAVGSSSAADNAAPDEDKRQ